VLLSPGKRLRSSVCTTEVIIVRAGSADVDLRCGGQPLIDAGDTPAPAGLPAPQLDTGTLLGKRYTPAGVDGLEVLVVKAGQGTLSVGDTPLVTKDARPLPASD
jgi:hypothetical protein